ncbi:hypothetical protein GAYE_SCF42G5529 [Galdieria yellowstonensis]|uniref:HTH La-type RNA-binding domain-containing protein n=1 Tax=Galdieria yellowstonensis TaxID=3028027 RepID=A0AAV9IJV0_9RHOD|nr:hypothetical protein GAYE_SCF42G5529 [Galdieria yellowstonensis]
MTRDKDWEVMTDLVQLKKSIVKQVEWYLSDANLLKDYFLLQQMDLSGAVPLSVIASFPKMLQLTQDTNIIQEAIVEYATMVQFDEQQQQQRIRRVDSNEYVNRNQVVKLTIWDVSTWECVESCLSSCGLWNCLLFGFLDIANCWNFVFPSEWHAKAVQYRMVQMFPLLGQYISLGTANDAMYFWQTCCYDNNIQQKEEYEQQQQLAAYYYYPLLSPTPPPPPPSFAIMGDAGIPAMVETYPCSQQPRKNSTSPPLSHSSSSFKDTTTPVQYLPMKEQSNRSWVTSSDDSAIQDKKPERKSQNIRNSTGGRRRKQSRRKGKQSGKERMRKFQIEAEDFPPLPGRATTTSDKSPSVDEISLAFGELNVSQQVSERCGKSYANVAATAGPFVENQSSICNDEKQRNNRKPFEENKPKRRNLQGGRNPTNTDAHVHSGRKEMSKETTKHKRRRNRKRNQVEEWNEEWNLVNQEEAQSSSTCDVNKEEKATEPQVVSLFAEKGKNVVEELEEDLLSHSSDESTCSAARQEGNISSGRLSPTAVDSTCCCNNWQLAQVSEPIATVENIICDDEAKSILRVLEQLSGSTTMEGRTDNSFELSSTLEEKVVEDENKQADGARSPSVVLRSSSSTTVSCNRSNSVNFKISSFLCHNTFSSSSCLEEGLKFFAKDIF